MCSCLVFPARAVDTPAALRAAVDAAVRPVMAGHDVPARVKAAYAILEQLAPMAN